MIAGNQPFTVENSEQLWVTLSRLVRDLDVVLRFLHTHSLSPLSLSLSAAKATQRFPEGSVRATEGSEGCNEKEIWRGRKSGFPFLPHPQNRRERRRF